MPGLIDMNANLQNNLKDMWEGFEHGTSAAASGGVTTLVDLPTMKRPILDDVDWLSKHIEMAQGKIKVDVAFIAYIND